MHLIEPLCDKGAEIEHLPQRYGGLNDSPAVAGKRAADKPKNQVKYEHGWHIATPAIAQC